ncbi:MAG: hypothetical protein ACREQQ_00900 [Candidatus Binatia bacterium]
MPRNPDRVPLVVGVTGHRDLRRHDVLPLAHAVKRVLTELRDAHPRTPLVILSPHAEGALPSAVLKLVR